MDSIQELQKTALQPGIVLVPQLVSYVGSILKRRNVPQKPEVFYYDGFQTVPFALISPEFIYPNVGYSQPIVQNDNSKKLAAIGLLILAAFALNDNL